MFLNHGYHFFAPEPAPSTLISFEAERADGTKVAGHFPSRKSIPRLLYHRHFMLTEHLHAAELRDAPDELLRRVGQVLRRSHSIEIWGRASQADRPRPRSSVSRRGAERRQVERSGKL